VISGGVRSRSTEISNTGTTSWMGARDRQRAGAGIVGPVAISTNGVFTGGDLTVNGLFKWEGLARKNGKRARPFDLRGSRFVLRGVT